MEFLEPAKAAPYYRRIAQFYEEVNNRYFVHDRYGWPHQ